ncbi:MAG: lipid A biosynthesis acyltransferase [Hyphomicrobiaceae bacterium]|nr:lipid A biosynthesis acyltransferase [Hyphomicrobiaceae bacterium]MCB1529186.1 lipid A biosynthesis acyltransferase [Hyphomicrobiaceae bacterium]
MPMKPIPLLRDFQFRLEYYALRFVVATSHALPLEVACNLSAWTWRRLAPIINPKRHARALANIAIAFPDKTDAERLAIANAHWENLGRVMIETMRIDELIHDTDRIEIKHPKIFLRYRDKLGPIVGVSLHMGNWELAIWPLTIAGAEPAAVYRSVNNPYVDQYLRDQRRDLYPGGLFGRGGVEGDHGESQKTARVIMDYVRRGGRLGMVCDLYDRTGIPVPFFGKPALTQAIGVMIARRVGARVWLARCVRKGKSSRFWIELTELRIPRTADQGADIRAAMAEMQQVFERWVREYPEQWMWSNRRWS